MNKYIELFMKDNDLKVNEEFKIRDKAYNPYHFDERGELIDSNGSEKIYAVAKLLMEKFKVEKIYKGKFIPKVGESYWYISNFGAINCVKNDNDVGEIFLFDNQPVFRTKKEAEDYKWYLEKLNEYKYEFSQEEWENKDITKYFLFYNVVDKTINFDWQCMVNRDVNYFYSREKAQQFIEEVGEERIRKYMFGVWY